jgi:hypothetical protein
LRRLGVNATEERYAGKERHLRRRGIDCVS